MVSSWGELPWVQVLPYDPGSESSSSVISWVQACQVVIFQPISAFQPILALGILKLGSSLPRVYTILPKTSQKREQLHVADVEARENLEGTRLQQISTPGFSNHPIGLTRAVTPEPAKVPTMSGPECCSNPPASSGSGSGEVLQIASLNSYVSGNSDSEIAVLLVSDVY
ncbi:hypothetical protein R6Q59_021297, partial [Mikania micrantha]